MVLCAYFSHNLPRHEDKELAELIDEMNEKSKRTWCAETKTYYERKWFFFTKEYSWTFLYLHIRGSEFQSLLCVRTLGEAKAYLYGALGQIESKQ